MAPAQEGLGVKGNACNSPLKFIKKMDKEMSAWRIYNKANIAKCQQFRTYVVIM